MRYHSFANHVLIYRPCKLSDINDCVLKINQNLCRINKWASHNALGFNLKKSEVVVVFRILLDTSTFPKIVLDGIGINYVHAAKNLGIIFNQRLIIGKLYGMLCKLWTMQHFTPLRIRILMVKIYVMPSLLYGCEIFVNYGYGSRQETTSIILLTFLFHVHG